MMEFNNLNMRNNKEFVFLKQLQVSERTKDNYIRSLRSSFIRDVLREYCGTADIFEVDDIKQLWEVYSVVNVHPTNVNSHRNYSTAIMKYIRYLNNGEKYGKRRDYLKKKPRKNNK